MVTYHMEILPDVNVLESSERLKVNRLPGSFLYCINADSANR